MRKLIFSMLIVALGIGGGLLSSDAKEVSSNNERSPGWFKYIDGDPNDPANYFAVEGLPECCDGGVNLCAILAEPGFLDSNRPDLSLIHQSFYKQ